MSTIRTILAASDFSFDAHRAVRRAALLAREHSASLQLLHVVDGAAGKAWRQRWLPSAAIEQSVLHEAQRGLESLAEDVATTDGVHIDKHVRSGAVLEEILLAAENADMVVLGPRGLRPVHDFILGTTAERLLNRSKRPMLIVKQNPASSYRRLFVPVDFSDHSIAALSFAQQLAPLAEICLFHAVDFLVGGKLKYAGVSDESIAEYRRQIDREARQQMDGFIAGANRTDVPLLPIIESGDARNLITAKAAEYAADLIVMGKHGQSRLAEYLLGGATRLTLARSTCDVAVIPDTLPS